MPLSVLDVAKAIVPTLALPSIPPPPPLPSSLPPIPTCSVTPSTRPPDHWDLSRLRLAVEDLERILTERRKTFLCSVWTQLKRKGQTDGCTAALPQQDRAEAVTDPSPTTTPSRVDGTRSMEPPNFKNSGPCGELIDVCFVWPVRLGLPCVAHIFRIPLV